MGQDFDPEPTPEDYVTFYNIDDTVQCDKGLFYSISITLTHSTQQLICDPLGKKI